MDNNIILLSDSYKFSHFKQYPPEISEAYCYFESRGGRFPYTVFFGLQYLIKKRFLGQVVTEEKIEEAKEFSRAHFGAEGLFNEAGWRYILEHHNGHLPVRISAVAEGSVIPVKNVLFTVVNTDPKCYWLPGQLETLLVQTWYPMTVATNSRIQKQMIAKYLGDTQGDLTRLPFMLHDFGFRGVSSVESAALGGAAHLVNFQGSDTIPGIMMLKQYYNHSMAGFSVAAAEHSTITSWGREGEVEAYRNMLTQFPNGLVSIVSDSYNIWECIKKLFGEELKTEITTRGKNGGTLIVRPDSGDPTDTVLKCLDLLKEQFGHEINGKGFKLLPPHIRVMQGDGISYKSLAKILEHMKASGWSAENLAFGSGGALLQKVDRDTQKCAYKCSEVIVSGISRDVYKDPITDPGKKSKKGKLVLHKVDGQFQTSSEKDIEGQVQNLLLPVFENGKLLKNWSLEEVRKNAELCDSDIDIMEFLANNV